MNISPFVFWGLVLVMVIQIGYNLDGWRIYGHAHRGIAAGSIALVLAALLMDAFA